MKLVSMVDYVLQINDKGGYGAYYSKIVKYAQFLKQPLKLEMFVPCDDKCNVLNMWTELNGYVILYNNNSDRLNKIQKISQGDVKGFIKYEGSKYQKAQEKVLFKGFDVKESKLGGCLLIYNRESYLLDSLFSLSETIEGLLKYLSELELTENAIKQLKQ